MKTKWIILVLIGAALLAACTPAAPAETGTGAASTPESVDAQATDAASVNAAPASAPDLFGLTYVREEEKLARDVYLFLYERWGAEVFNNIAASEQAHTDTIKSLLVVYGLPDPAVDLQPGQFADPALQALYDQLTAQGSQSLSDAFKVGAAVEEIDILDLQARLAGDLPDDIRLAYENLLSGSYNHLSAFTSALLRQTGETYVPQYMTAEAYQEALSLAVTGGNGGGGGSGGGRP
ncbi:MAG: hypothetical protein FD146_2217 [Anaerolineaceae bacterium]|nr:MAG: hypothetical protein FD146_2217 [Anaerolineaceae bacterium]